MFPTTPTNTLVVGEIAYTDTIQVLAMQWNGKMDRCDAFEATKIASDPRNCVSLIICDHEMCPVNGLGIARTIKRNTGRAVPVIIWSKKMIDCSQAGDLSEINVTFVTDEDGPDLENLRALIVSALEKESGIFAGSPS
jgi:CheY-like chemotaxis protein